MSGYAPSTASESNARAPLTLLSGGGSGIAYTAVLGVTLAPAGCAVVSSLLGGCLFFSYGGSHWVACGTSRSAFGRIPLSGVEAGSGAGRIASVGSRACFNFLSGGLVLASCNL